MGGAAGMPLGAPIGGPQDENEHAPISEDFVERLSYAPIARHVNDKLDPAARIRIIGSARSAYLHRVCAVTYVWDDPWIAPAVDDLAGGPRLIEELRDQGFTHVLLDTGEMEPEANGVYRFRVPEKRPPGA